MAVTRMWISGCPASGAGVNLVRLPFQVGGLVLVPGLKKALALESVQDQIQPAQPFLLPGTSD